MTTLPCSSTRSRQLPLRLLLVDDSPDVLHDLQLLLELSGEMMIVGQTSNGLEAVTLAASLLPDVILLDLELPGQDGFEATRQIKSQQPAPRVIILSIHASPGDREHARASGADAFVVKGSSYEVLRNAILGAGGSPNSMNNHIKEKT
jgi:two-component system, NarL family, response regulator DesR